MLHFLERENLFLTLYLVSALPHQQHQRIRPHKHQKDELVRTCRALKSSVVGKRAAGLQIADLPGKYLCHFSARMLSTACPAVKERLALSPVFHGHGLTRDAPVGGTTEPPAWSPAEEAYTERGTPSQGVELKSGDWQPLRESKMPRTPFSSLVIRRRDSDKYWILSGWGSGRESVLKSAGRREGGKKGSPGKQGRHCCLAGGSLSNVLRSKLSVISAC